MSRFADRDVVIGLKKENEICLARGGAPMYDYFQPQTEVMSGSLAIATRDARATEIDWHREVAESDAAVLDGRNIYIKYRELVKQDVVGADLTPWDDSTSTPDELEVGLEEIIDTIEDHREELPYAQVALAELLPLEELLSKERGEARESQRRYQEAVAEKNKVRVEAEALFLKVRRFIRRDLGRESPEYRQLKDRKIREKTKADPSLPLPPSEEAKEEGVVTP